MHQGISSNRCSRNYIIKHYRFLKDLRFCNNNIILNMSMFQLLYIKSTLHLKAHTQKNCALGNLVTERKSCYWKKILCYLKIKSKQIKLKWGEDNATYKLHCTHYQVSDQVCHNYICCHNSKHFSEEGNSRHHLMQIDWILIIMDNEGITCLSDMHEVNEWAVYKEGVQQKEWMEEWRVREKERKTGWLVFITQCREIILKNEKMVDNCSEELMARPQSSGPQAIVHSQH